MEECKQQDPTQADMNECKTFFAAQMEECKTFQNGKIVTKVAELVQPNAGRPKRIRVSSSGVYDKKHRTHGTARIRNS
jgi:hypothetical protein